MVRQKDLILVTLILGHLEWPSVRLTLLLLQRGADTTT
jgi:hypothetical protein